MSARAWAALAPLSAEEQNAINATQDDAGAEHAAYLKGEQVGHARGLAEGRGAVVMMLREVMRNQREPSLMLVVEIIERIEQDAADPAGYERGRADAVRDAAAWLCGSHDPTITPQNAARRIEQHEAELQQARAADRASKGGEGR